MGFKKKSDGEYRKIVHTSVHVLLSKSGVKKG